MKELNYANKILEHPKYKEYTSKINILEEDRTFCKHNLEHFLNVARIAYIINLEEGLEINKDIIYCTALLHDIGRWKQYEDGTKHQKASSYLSYEILKQVGLNSECIEQIQEAILNHSNKSRKAEKNLVGIIYRADKSSRNCFNCSSYDQCDWDNELKNRNIKV